jgi:hypothetical protein
MSQRRLLASERDVILGAEIIASLCDLILMTHHQSRC